MQKEQVPVSSTSYKSVEAEPVEVYLGGLKIRHLSPRSAATPKFLKQTLGHYRSKS